MRIAVLIVGLILNLGLFFQALLITGLSDAANQDKTQEAGALGLLGSFCWLIAVALVIPFPRVATGLFLIAAAFCFGGAAEYPDLWFWGSVAVVLAVGSVVGYYGKKKAKAKEVERDRLLAQATAAQQYMAWHLSQSGTVVPTTQP